MWSEGCVCGVRDVCVCGVGDVCGVRDEGCVWSVWSEGEGCVWSEGCVGVYARVHV